MVDCLRAVVSNRRGDPILTSSIEDKTRPKLDSGSCFGHVFECGYILIGKGVAVLI